MCKLRHRGEISINTSNGKLNLAFEEKTQLTQLKQKTEAEIDMEIKDWEKRSSQIALCESQREVESQRMQLHQAKQWVDQAQGEKINLR